VQTQIDQLARLLDVAMQDPRVVIVSPDASRSFRLSAAACATPGKVIDVGVAEAAGLGMAYGLACRGFKALMLGFSSFLVLRGIEPLRSLIGYHAADVTILGGMSGLTNSRDGFMHQSTDDIGILSSIGSLRVVTPSDESSLCTAMSSVLAATGPQFVRLCRTVIDLGPAAAPLTAWTPIAVRIDAGSDFAIVSYGHLLGECVRAVASLQERGRRGKLIEVLQMQPFDARALLDAVGDAALVVSVEDHVVSTGLGGRLRAVGIEHAVPSRRLVTLGLREGEYGTSGTLGDVLAHYGLDAQHIAATVLSRP
jgi:transketolase